MCGLELVTDVLPQIVSGSMALFHSIYTGDETAWNPIYSRYNWKRTPRLTFDITFLIMTIINSAGRVCTRILELISGCLKSILDILLFVLSFKVFPLAWHVSWQPRQLAKSFQLLSQVQARSYYSFLFRHKLNNRPVPLTTLNTPTIFQPTIWTSSTPLGEIDIMGHKTNSTYATDFDVARNYHICSLFRVGMKAWGDLSFVNPQTRDTHGTGLFFPALAGVNFTFHRAIRPGQKYEICTRVLSWDYKWLHLISHFVERGNCKPTHLSDQRNPQLDPEMNIGNLADSQCVDQGQHSGSVVFATAMAKIVFKKGRKTVPPPQFLADCGLLPHKEMVATAESAQISSEDEKLDDNNMTKIGENIERIRATNHRVAEHLNSLDEGCSFYNMSEKVFFSKRWGAGVLAKMQVWPPESPVYR